MSRNHRAAVLAALGLAVGCGGGFSIAGNNNDEPPACGDGVQTGAEECDGDDLGGATCAGLGLLGGALACDDTCAFDVGGCDAQAECGNGAREYPESCDGSDLAGAICQSLGFDEGELACAADCRFDTAGCVTYAVCGDDVAQTGEDCDGEDLAGASCQSLGYDGGELSCATNCTFDRSRCEGGGPECGNGLVELGEDCDGVALDGADCLSLGHTGGVLACDLTCAFDESGCTDVACGNGVAEVPEQCDGADLGGATCESLGFTGGTLGCDGSCAFDAAGCAGGCSATGGPVSCGDAVSDDTGSSPDAVDEIDAWEGAGCQQWQMQGPEIVYEVSSPTGEGIEATLTGLAADLDLIVLEGSGFGCTPLLPCLRWSANGGQQDEAVTFYAYPNTSYYVVVDGYNGAAGPFDLSLSCVDVEICDDGLDNDADGEVDCADGDCNGVPQCYVQQVYEFFPYNSASNDWDLDHTSITFVPDPTAVNGYAWTTQAQVATYPSAPGSGSPSTVLTFSQAEDAVEVVLPGAQTFPFFGQSHGSVWVNTNGTLTFGAADPWPGESVWDLVHGLPRIAGAWDAYDVTAGGVVTVDEHPNRLTVTFHQLVDPWHGGALHSFQVELFWNGQIVITNLSHPGTDGLVGISAGGGSWGPAGVDFHDPGALPEVPGLYEHFDQNNGDTFDLAGRVITFTPDPGVSAGYTYQLAATSLGWVFPPGGGTLSTATVPFSHGDSAEPVSFTAPHTVTFFGQTYDSFFVGSNGYVTFGDPDSQWIATAANHFGLPRLSGHFYDWEPDDSGLVTVDEFLPAGGQYTVVVTFQNVPHYDNPHPTISFQMAINAAGVVTYYYHDINTGGGLVGISSGVSGSLPVEVDFRP